MGGGDFGHRAGRYPDRRPDLVTQPSGGACPRRNLSNGLSKRFALAVIFLTAPAHLEPLHHDALLTIGNVTRRGSYVLLDRRGDHSTPWTHRGGLLGGDHVHHPRPVSAPFDTLDPYSWQPEQQCRTVRHSPCLLPPEIPQTSDFGRPR